MAIELTSIQGHFSHFGAVFASQDVHWIRNFGGVSYLFSMRKTAFEPCLPSRGTKVPAAPEWLHEVKYDGYRMIVQREGKRVRLFTMNGHDWTKRYPRIVEAALKNRSQSFVVDGEAVLLGVD